MGFLTDLYAGIEAATGISPAMQVKLIYTTLLLVLAPVVQRVVLAVIRRRAKDPNTVYRALVVIRYTLAVMVVVLLAFIWISGFKNLATYASIVSAGLVIALQDTIANIAGFAFIIWRKPFVLGDRIEIDGITGDIIDVRVFQFTVVEVRNWVDADQSTGRIVHIPNSKVITEPVANYTTGFQYIWNEVPVLVTFESDWRGAKKILADIAADICEKFTPEAAKQIKQAAQRYLIIAGKLDPIVYTSVKDSGIMLTLRYLTHARQRRGTEEAVWEAILDAFATRDDIDFAYPTIRYYENRSEGKPGARAD